MTDATKPKEKRLVERFPNLIFSSFDKFSFFSLFLRLI